VSDTRELNALIDRVELGAASERNRRRGKKVPAIGVGTSGLTPIHDDPREFTRRIDTWLGIAREVFGH
jgi:hypothetical protein